MHVGPGRPTAELRGTDEQAERAAALRRQLQSAEVALVKLAALRDHRTHTGAAEGLIQGPQLVGCIRWPNDDSLRQLDSPGRGIELLLPIHDDERLLLTSGARSSKGQSRSLPQVFHQGATPQAATGQAAVQGRRTGGYHWPRLVTVHER